MSTTCPIARTELTLDEARAIRACAGWSITAAAHTLDTEASDGLCEGVEFKAIDTRHSMTRLRPLADLLDTVGWLHDEAGYVAEGCDEALLDCVEMAGGQFDDAVHPCSDPWDPEALSPWATMIALYRRLTGEEKLPTEERARILLAGVDARAAVMA